VLCTALPLFHTNALNTLFQALITGATAVFEPRFSGSAASPIGHGIEKHRHQTAAIKAGSASLSKTRFTSGPGRTTGTSQQILADVKSACDSTSPGFSVAPAQSMVSALPCTIILPGSPISAMRFPFTSTPPANDSRPLPSSTRALRNSIPLTARLLRSHRSASHRSRLRGVSTVDSRVRLRGHRFANPKQKAASRPASVLL
jgi:hypothetical protein